MRILILGGSGFIGIAVAKALSDRGHPVAALARDVEAASRRLPRIDWIAADLVDLATPGAWTAMLEGFDAVVNCAGVLQDTARDDVAKVQERAMRALYEAAAPAGLHMIVQVSARTGGSGGETPFLATKRRADDALKASGIPFVILRPAVVIGRNAYGGSALLRALAAFPRVTPLVHADTPMQFVSMNDLVSAVADSLDGTIASGSDFYLAAGETLTLARAVSLHRRWLGLPEAPVLHIPAAIAASTSLIADCLGRLGWRSPLRSTAMLVARGGVTGDTETGDDRLATLAETLAANPAGVQDLWFARLYLAKPLIFGTLAAFWIASGVIALAGWSASAGQLSAAGFSSVAAAILTLTTSLADILLGVGAVVRRFASAALKGMIVLSVIYLLAATALTPELWLEPLGPLVKVFPSVVLALVALAILEER